MCYHRNRFSRSNVALGAFIFVGVRIIFFISGYSIHIMLARILGPNLYGIWGVVLGILNVYQKLMLSGACSAISKFTAEFPKQAYAILKQGLRVQIVLSISLCFLLLFMSSYMASWLFKDARLIPYIRATVFFVPLLGAYAVYVGSLNGLRSFVKQAIVIAVYVLTRLILVSILVLIGYKVYGAITGSFISLLVAVVLARRYCSPLSETHAFDWKKILFFAFPVTLFFLTLGIIMSLDIFMLKALGSQNKQVGFYTSAVVLAQIPYILSLGFSTAIFPSIAGSLSDPRQLRAKFYISSSLRYVLLAVAPITFLMSSTSGSLISLVFTDRYATASIGLSILAFGYMFLSLFHIATTVITATGKPKTAAAIAFFMVGLDLVLNILLIPRYGLNGAALATTVTSCAGMLLALTYVFHLFKRLMNPVSVAKILGSSMVISVLSVWVSLSGIQILISYTILLMLYFTLLLFLKEVGKEELLLLKRIFALFKTD